MTILPMIRRLIVGPLDRLTRPPTDVEADEWIADMKRRETESIEAERQLRENNPLVRSLFGVDRHSTRRPT